MSELEKTMEWFKQAIPEPTDEHKCIQLGCHIEEFAEMLNSLGDCEEHDINELSTEYKQCHEWKVNCLKDSLVTDKESLLDSLADQIVTAIGVAHMFGFDIEGALAEVNRSNFSKFENGKPVFDKDGKITKGKDYTPPQLDKFI